MAIGGQGPFELGRQERAEGRGQEFGARQNPYLPQGPKPMLFDQFEGINTNTTRPGVPDNMMYWCDGFMPLAPRNLRTLYGVSAAQFTPAGTTVVFYKFMTINGTNYCIVLCANGSVQQFNTDTLVGGTILAASTITSPTIPNVGFSQWGNEYVIIVANQTNGYWLWNGSLVFTAGTLAPTASIVASGGGYPANVTLSVIGGTGISTSLAASVSGGQIISVSVVLPGSLFVATDNFSVLILPQPTGGSGGSISITSFGTISVGGGITLSSINAIGVAANGANYTTPTLTFTRSTAGVPPDATQVDATGVAIVTTGQITAVTLLNRGSYYANSSFATIFPTCLITDNGAVATVSVHLMPFGIQGHAVETYSGHVWVAKGATLFWSAPGFPDDFATSNGGGNATANDSCLKQAYTQLIAANGFLYLIADSSVFYISGVQTSGSPPTTSFTRQNADPEVGSPYPLSVIPFGRNVLMANSYGIHTISGGKVSKVSEMLDGVYNTVASFGGLQLSAAQATIFGNRVWMVLVRLVDPVSGSTVNKVLMWDGGKKWWASSQEVTLSTVAYQEVQSVISAWGSDGTSIYKIFNQASSSLAKVVQSRLYDAPGGITFRKAATRAWGAANFKSNSSTNLSLSIDNEAGTMATAHTITGGSIGSIFVFPPLAVNQQGKLTGLTIKTNAADMEFIMAMLQDEVIEYRG